MKGLTTLTLDEIRQRAIAAGLRREYVDYCLVAIEYDIATFIKVIEEVEKRYTK